VSGPGVQGRGEPADLQVSMRLPVVYCADCRSQVLLTDAIGRPTMPTFRRGESDELVCVFCAGKAADPADLHPLWHLRDMCRGYVAAAGDPVPELASWELLVRLGADLDVTR
jgi:hypothetical protein